MHWERLALAAIAGAIGGYLLAKRQEPELTLADIFGDLADNGDLIEWDGTTILQSVIEDEF